MTVHDHRVLAYYIALCALAAIVAYLIVVGAATDTGPESVKLVDTPCDTRWQFAK